MLPGSLQIFYRTPTRHPPRWGTLYKAQWKKTYSRASHSSECNGRGDKIRTRPRQNPAVSNFNSGNQLLDRVNPEERDCVILWATMSRGAQPVEGEHTAILGERCTYQSQPLEAEKNLDSQRRDKSLSTYYSPPLFRHFSRISVHVPYEYAQIKPENMERSNGELEPQNCSGDGTPKPISVCCCGQGVPINVQFYMCLWQILLLMHESLGRVLLSTRYWGRMPCGAACWICV